jgi:hypothetical protein
MAATRDELPPLLDPLGADPIVREHDRRTKRDLIEAILQRVGDPEDCPQGRFAHEALNTQRQKRINLLAALVAARLAERRWFAATNASTADDRVVRGL